MIIGNTRKLTCPFCGKKKEVISLLSGNTFRAVVWSDEFMDAPKCPEPSQIQKCPHCGKYYLVCEQESIEYGTSESFDKGELSFTQVKEAYDQLADSVSSKNIPVLLQSVIFAYNNEYGRKGVTPSAEDKRFFTFCLQSALNNHSETLDPVLVGEYYREMGNFSACIKTLGEITPNSEYQEFVISHILKKAESQDDRLFVIPNFQDEIERRRQSVKNEPVPDLAEYIANTDDFTIEGLISFAKESKASISAIRHEEACELYAETIMYGDQAQWNSKTMSPIQAYNIAAYDVIQTDALRINTLYRKAFEHIDAMVWNTNSVSVICYGEVEGLGILSLYAYLKEHDISVDKLKEVKLFSCEYDTSENCDCFHEHMSNILKTIFPQADVLVKKGFMANDVETSTTFTIHLMDEKYFEANGDRLDYDTSMLTKDLEQRSCSLFDIIISISPWHNWETEMFIGNTRKLASDSCKVEGEEEEEEWHWVISANYDIPEAYIPESDDRKVILILAIDKRMPGNNPAESLYNTCHDLCKEHPTVGTFNTCIDLIRKYQEHMRDHLHGKEVPFLSNLYIALLVSVNFKSGDIMGEQKIPGLPDISRWPDESPLYLVNKAVCLKKGLGVKRDVEQAIDILEGILREHEEWAEKNPEVYRQLALSLGFSFRIPEAHNMFMKYAAHDNCECICFAKLQIAKFHKRNGDVSAWLDYVEDYTKEGTGCASCHSALNYDSEKRVCPKVQLAAAFDYEDGKIVPQDYEKAFHYYMQAAMQGEVTGEFMVGSYLSSGRGCVKNKEEAKKWLTIAAEKGFRKAQGLLSVIYQKEGNLPRAFYWLRILCTPDDHQTQFEIARILLINKLPGWGKWLRLSAKGGYSEAQYLQALLSSDKKSKVDWLKKAARQGHKEALEELNKIFGKTFDIDEIESIELDNPAEPMS